MKTYEHTITYKCGCSDSNTMSFGVKKEDKEPELPDIKCPDCVEKIKEVKKEKKEYDSSG